MAAAYVEFHARSAFSFLEGASHPEALADACAQLQLPAMALLDRDGVYGAARFHLWAKKLNVKAHIGAELTCVDAATDGYRLPVIAASREGYQNMCRLITRAKLRAAKEASTTSTDEIAQFAKGMVCLTGDERGPLAEALLRGKRIGGPAAAMEEGRRCLQSLMRLFGAENVYVE